MVVPDLRSLKSIQTYKGVGGMEVLDRIKRRRRCGQTEQSTKQSAGKDRQRERVCERGVSVSVSEAG
eukprot:scaffold37682_cov183-Skeletonema_marinoi.AAC.3